MDRPKYCYSCEMPLTPQSVGAKDNYCTYCTDPTGDVKSKQEIRTGIAQWLKSWQPGIDEKTAVAFLIARAISH
jgi:hypothetical protein